MRRMGAIIIPDGALSEEHEMQKERQLLEDRGKCFPEQVLPPLLSWPPLWVHVAILQDGRVIPSSPRLSHAEAVLAAKWDVLADRERANEEKDEDEEQEFGDA